MFIAIETIFTQSPFAIFQRIVRIFRNIFHICVIIFDLFTGKIYQRMRQLPGYYLVEYETSLSAQVRPIANI